MTIPSDRSADSTMALLRQGYTFISDRCRQLGNDVFRTRLLLTPAVCLQGEEAARVFYAPDRFTRRRALPMFTFRLLQDKGSVAALDGTAHHHRKRMFLDLLTPPEAVAGMRASFEAAWRAALPKWQLQAPLSLHDALRPVLFRAVCDWAGLPTDEAHTAAHVCEIGAMIDHAGAAGPENWWAALLRRRTERWLREEVIRLRAEGPGAPGSSPARALAHHRDEHGRLLDAKVAAVELLNIVRPTVAVSRFITFAALALHQNPEWRERLARQDDGPAHWRFVQEVRRLAPFFPAVGGRVLQPFEWRGQRFRKGEWVILDLYGTDHDGRAWRDPERFDPERFREWDGSPFNFVPQGGGDVAVNHRCPGENITIALTEAAVRFLTRELTYSVPADQDLSVDLGAIPALPRSGFVIANIGAVERSAALPVGTGVRPAE